MFQPLHMIVAATLVVVTSQTIPAGASPWAPAAIAAIEIQASDTLSMAGVATDATRFAATAQTSCRAPLTAYGKVGGYAPGIVKRQIARTRALAKWRHNARIRDGRAYASWRRARNRTLACDTSLGADHCVATAEPCTGT
ncbi:MAG: hypothetical protein AAFQ42_12740 [Pseudomonadota bacterium]